MFVTGLAATKIERGVATQAGDSLDLLLLWRMAAPLRTAFGLSDRVVARMVLIVGTT